MISPTSTTSINRNILFFLSLSIILGSCKPDPLIIDKNLLTKYNSMANPSNSPKAVEEINCYLDYSLGMGQGMKATSALNDRLKNFLGGKKVKYFKVGASVPPVEIDINSPAANFVNLNNFTDPSSKLKSAVDRIVGTSNGVSIFITDFERIEDVGLKQSLPGAPKQHPIDASAWAQNNFKEWLLEGNQIDVFASQYNKPDTWFAKKSSKGINNWIYTIVFTPGDVIKEENLYKRSVLKFLSDEYQISDGVNSKHFVYTVNNFNIEQEKNAEATGNANENLIVKALITDTKNAGFEYYEFDAQDILKLNTDESQLDKRIINKIKLSYEMPCFSDIQYGIKVYDITQSLTDFNKAITQDAPIVNQNVETGEKDTVANKPIKYDYTKGTSDDNTFDFVFNTATKEIGIKAKPDFTGVAEETTYQIDIIVKSAKLKDFTQEDSVLRLNYDQGYSIKSLGESLKFAMQDVAVNLENKVLYTIYIKLNK